MTCFRPLECWKSAKPGGGLAFHVRDGYADRPMKVSCGRCIGCKLAHAQEWETRCVHEAQMHDQSIFLTLTYSDQHLPADYSVSVRPLQLFQKKLRNHYGGKLRFFACGEYGETTFRPHYHMIVFGLWPSDPKIHTQRNGHYVYTSATLARLWGLGLCEFGSVTSQSAGYVARYTLKKVSGDPAPAHYSRIHPLTGELVRVRPEFLTMSRRPGLGFTWLQKYHRNVFPCDYIVINGQKRPVPEFYKEKLLANDPAMALKIAVSRAGKARKQAHNATGRRLLVRENCTQARINTLKRTLE